MANDYNERYDKHDRYEKSGKAGQPGQPAEAGEQEVVEFHGEMPRVPEEKIEFIADEKLEDELSDEI